MGESNIAEKSIEITQQLCERYLNHPEELCRKRQLIKLNKKFESLKKKYSYSKEELFHELIRLAKLRTITNPTNVFLVNAGSSGSHWVEAMLNEINEIICLNEVYFSTELRNEIKKLDDHGKQMVMNLVHLCHSPILSDETASSVFVNSAHTKGTRFYRSIDSECICILLIRDPLNITISRTFRKKKFKQSIAPQQNDIEYFNKNLNIVKRWYERNMTAEFDLKCKYESFVENGKNELYRILNLLNIESADNHLDEIVKSHNRGNILANLKKNKANLYTGGITPIQEELENLGIEKLRQIRNEFGYD